MATASEPKEPYGSQDASIKRRQSSEFLSFYVFWMGLSLFFYIKTDLMKLWGGMRDET